MLSQSVILTVVLACSTCSQASDELGSLAWFQAEWAKAERFELPPRVFVEFDFLTYPSMTQSEVDQLEASIRGKPDHPSWSRVDRQRRLLSLGVEAVVYRVWYWDDNDWRCNQDMPQDFAPFADFGRRSNRLWANCTPQLTLTTVESMPRDRAYDKVINGRVEKLAQLMSCGFAAGLGVGVEPSDASLQGSRWIGTARNGTGDKVLQWTGRVDQEQVLIEKCQVIRNDKFPKSVGLTMTYEDWVESEIFSRRIPTHTEWVRPDGALQYESTLRLHEPLRQSEFAKIGRVPDRGSVDVIRGIIQPATLADFRPGRGAFVTFADPENGIEETSVALPQAVRETDAGLLVWFGRGIAVLAIAATVFVVWNRRQ